MGLAEVDGVVVLAGDLVAGRFPKVSAPGEGATVGTTLQSTHSVRPDDVLFSQTLAAATSRMVSTIDITTIATLTLSVAFNDNTPLDIVRHPPASHNRRVLSL